MKDPNRWLIEAQKAFGQGDYQGALRLYQEVLIHFPNLIEAKVGIVLSDFAESNAEEAEVLFDFYYMARQEEDERDLLRTIEAAIEQLVEIAYRFTRLQENVALESDGIRYSDFVALAKERSSFKEAFEDILFSTKVIITSKEEFVDFVRHLVDAGMQETALKYLDASGAVFGNDQEVLALYGMVKGIRS